MSLLKRESQPNRLVYIGELLHGQTFSPKMVMSLLLVASQTYCFYCFPHSFVL